MQTPRQSSRGPLTLSAGTGHGSVFPDSGVAEGRGDLGGSYGGAGFLVQRPVSFSLFSGFCDVSIVCHGGNSLLYLVINDCTDRRYFYDVSPCTCRPPCAGQRSFSRGTQWGDVI